MITFAYQDICYIIFLMILFRLEYMIIRICNKDDDKETLRKKQKESEYRWIVYLVLMAIMMIFEFPGLSRIKMPISNTAEYAVADFVIRFFAFFVILYIHALCLAH